MSKPVRDLLTAALAVAKASFRIATGAEAKPTPARFLVVVLDESTVVVRDVRDRVEYPFRSLSSAEGGAHLLRNGFEGFSSSPIFATKPRKRARA